MFHHNARMKELLKLLHTDMAEGHRAVARDPGAVLRLRILWSSNRLERDSVWEF